MEVVLIGAVIIAAVLGYIFFAKHRKQANRTASTCGDTPHPGGTMDPQAWHIGPTLWDGNHSPGMPEHPASHPDGLTFDFPTDEASKVDYLTFNHGSLAGKSRIILRYRLEAEEGVSVFAVPEGVGVYPTQITPYFQREGDDWTTSGKFEAYRWYHSQGHYLQKGDHEIVVPLDSGWTGALISSLNPADAGGFGSDGSPLPEYNPTGFKDAIDNACCVGFVFGGNDVGIGHGARATGPARFVLLKYRVE